MNKKQNALFLYLLFWGIFSFGAFVWQFFFPHLAAEGTVWGVAVGWQREIALWNLAIDAAIFFTIMKRNFTHAQLLTNMLIFLSFILGINHLHSAVFSASKSVTIHWIGFLLNELLGVGLGLYVLRKSK